MRFGRKDYNRRIKDSDNKIPEDEPVFLLRGQDELAPRLLLMWAMELRLRGGDPQMAKEAEDHAQEMIKWQKEHTVKTPDQYREPESRKIILNRIYEIIDKSDNGESIALQELIELIESYYMDPNCYEIVMKTDLKLESKELPPSVLSIEDIDMSKKTAKEVQDLYNKKFLIYCININQFKVIKFTI